MAVTVCNYHAMLLVGGAVAGAAYGIVRALEYEHDWIDSFWLPESPLPPIQPSIIQVYMYSAYFPELSYGVLLYQACL
jgi:hypothetical protein